MNYRLQISRDEEWGANYKKRNQPDCENFLNESKLYSNLDVEIIVKDLIEKIEGSKYSTFEDKLSVLKSKSNYKILVIGVGEHNGNDIFLCEDKNNKADEIAHVDLQSEIGSWMNRLYIFHKKPEKIIFENTHLGRVENRPSFKFENNNGIIECNF